MDEETLKEINRALAKSIAYKKCGKHQDAMEWAARCHELMAVAGLFGDMVVIVRNRQV